MQIFWKIVAVLLAAGAVAWVIMANYERAFLFAAAGAVAWFLSYRAQLREKLNEIDESDERQTDQEDDDEPEVDDEVDDADEKTV